MKPIGPLMREHRLIERMVSLVNKEIRQIDEQHEANIKFLANAVDFFRTYADRTHHGKEENILFKTLDKKPLSQEFRRVMNELTEEHVWGRQKVSQLFKANEKYRYPRASSWFFNNSSFA